VVKATFLLDVNVLIAMTWPAHSAHKKVKEWLGQNVSEAWATCPFTQAAFVRTLSNPSFSPDALAPSHAVSLLQTYLEHPRHEFWADDLSLVQSLEPLTSPLRGHKQVTDAYLLGLAIHRKGKFATMDRGISDLLDDKRRSREFVELI
jgi:toxin-antitoxin system PIN domain toxin